MLSHAIGEYNVETYIGAFEFVDQFEADDASKAITLDQLPLQFKAIFGTARPPWPTG